METQTEENTIASPQPTVQWTQWTQYVQSLPAHERLGAEDDRHRAAMRTLELERQREWHQQLRTECERVITAHGLDVVSGPSRCRAGPPTLNALRTLCTPSMIQAAMAGERPTLRHATDLLWAFLEAARAVLPQAYIVAISRPLSQALALLPCVLCKPGAASRRPPACPNVHLFSRSLPSEGMEDRGCVPRDPSRSRHDNLSVEPLQPYVLRPGVVVGTTTPRRRTLLPFILQRDVNDDDDGTCDIVNVVLPDDLLRLIARWVGLRWYRLRAVCRAWHAAVGGVGLVWRDRPLSELPAALSAAQPRQPAPIQHLIVDLGDTDPEDLAKAGRRGAKRRRAAAERRGEEDVRRRAAVESSFSPPRLRTLEVRTDSNWCESLARHGVLNLSHVLGPLDGLESLRLDMARASNGMPSKQLLSKSTWRLFARHIVGPAGGRSGRLSHVSLDASAPTNGPMVPYRRITDLLLPAASTLRRLDLFFRVVTRHTKTAGDAWRHRLVARLPPWPGPPRPRPSTGTGGTAPRRGQRVGFHGTIGACWWCHPPDAARRRPRGAAPSALPTTPAPPVAPAGGVDLGHQGRQPEPHLRCPTAAERAGLARIGRRCGRRHDVGLHNHRSARPDAVAAYVHSSGIATGCWVAGGAYHQQRHLFDRRGCSGARLGGEHHASRPSAILPTKPVYVKIPPPPPQGEWRWTSSV